MVKYEAAVVVGTYTDKNGNEKARWMTVGAVIEKNGKLKMRLDATPVNFNGWIEFFEPKQKDGAPKGVKDIDSDLPF